MTTTLLTASATLPMINREPTVVSVSTVGISAPFVTPRQRFIDTNIIAQLSGSATSVTAKVERSAVDPDKATPHAAPADSAGFTGDLSAGIAPNVYTEPGIGWWRINITAISGGNCTASVSGRQG